MLQMNSRILRTAVALGAAVVAAAINGLLWPDFGLRYPLIGFYPAILVAALLAGAWGGAICTAASALIAAFVWLDPRLSMNVSRAADAVALAVFCLVGAVISVLTGYSSRRTTLERAARERAEAAEREVAQALDREQRARAEAEQANRLKDGFLSTVSHELRTPLNAVVGWTEMLRSGELAAPAQERALRAVADNAQRQMQLIDDLLDIGRIAAGTLRIELSATELATVVRKAIDVVEPAVRAKNLQVRVDCPSLVCRADPGRLQQVLWNLLTNAVKFTAPGGTIDVSIRRDEEAAEIRIRDTGAGIPLAFLPHVFEPFRQADSSATRAQPGLGLGLSIVKRLVEAHGGTIAAESGGEGQGACFVVRLPAATAAGFAPSFVDKMDMHA
jgi:signal transduction histidine kinase